MASDTRYIPAARTWRNRLFWAWQAWRLRKAPAQPSNGGVSVFNNFAALKHKGYADPLHELHSALATSTPGLAAAAGDDFQRRLSGELGKQSCIALFARGDGAVGGYVWGRVARYDEALEMFRQSPGLAHLRSSDWLRLLTCVPDNTPLLVCNDLGLDVRYRRGFAPLKQLLKPLFDLAQRHGAKRALWWAPRGGALHELSTWFGARPLHEGEHVTFFVLDDVRPLARVFVTLPAGDISDLLARLAPKRPPAPPRPTALNRELSLQPAQVGIVVATENEEVLAA